MPAHPLYGWLLVKFSYLDTAVWTFTFNIIPPTPFQVQFGRMLTSRAWWWIHPPADCTPRPWLNLLALVQGFELLFFYVIFSLIPKPHLTDFDLDNATADTSARKLYASTLL
jgi:hypothetical protein